MGGSSGAPFRPDEVFWLGIGIIILLLLEVILTFRPVVSPTAILESTWSDLLVSKGSEVKVCEISPFVVMLLSVLNLSARSINMFVKNRLGEEKNRNWLGPHKTAKSPSR